MKSSFLLLVVLISATDLPFPFSSPHQNSPSATLPFVMLCSSKCGVLPFPMGSAFESIFVSTTVAAFDVDSLNGPSKVR